MESVFSPLPDRGGLLDVGVCLKYILKGRLIKLDRPKNAING